MAIYTGTSGSDSHWGGSDPDRIEGLGGDDYLLGNEGNDEIFGGEGDDNLHGGTGNDLLEGGIGSDLLQGNEGADIVRGQAGDDRILLTSNDYGGIAGDSVDGGEGIDTLQFDGLSVQAPIVFSIADPAVAQNLGGASIVNIEHLAFRSGTGNDQITGGALGDFIDGFDGNDWIAGGLGNDSLDGGGGTDTVYGGDGNDTLNGGGGGTGDTLYGGDGDDVVRWNQDSLIDGGAGTDLLRVEYYGSAGLTVDLSNPDVESLLIATRITGIERLNFFAGSGNDRLTGGTGDDHLTGNGGDDILVGGIGNDILSGGDGFDQLSGGAGDDVLHNVSSDPNPSDLIDGGDGFDRLEYRVNQAAGPVAIDLLAGTGMVVNVEQISFSAWKGSGANIVSGGGEQDTIWGGGGSDTLSGRGGGDDLRGGAGDDFIYGGDGNDFIDGEGGADRLEGGEGDDLLRAGGTEASHLEGGAGNDEMSGGSGADTLIAGDGSDYIAGGGGGDVLDGGNGADRFVYYSVADSTSAAMDRIRHFESGVDKIDLTQLRDVRLSWVEATDGETGETYSLVTVRTGTETATIRVDSAVTRADFLADTVMDGSPGGDSLEGGEETDEISGHGGNDSIQGRGGDDVLKGGAGDDSLDGGSDDDLLDGGTGSDSMAGGAGDDVYVVDNAGDTVSENPSEGVDEIRTSLGAYSLAGLTNVENLTAATDSAHDFRGNSANNVIAGGGANDVFRLHDGGDDSVFGGVGNDNFFFIGTLTSADVVNGGSGGDTLVIQGPYGSLTLTSNITLMEGVSILGGNNTSFGEPGTNRYDYVLTTHDSNFAAGVQAKINGAALGLCSVPGPVCGCRCKQHWPGK